MSTLLCSIFFWIIIHKASLQALIYSNLGFQPHLRINKVCVSQLHSNIAKVERDEIVLRANFHVLTSLSRGLPVVRSGRKKSAVPCMNFIMSLPLCSGRRLKLVCFLI